MQILRDILNEVDKDDEEFPNLRDLSKHLYNIRIFVDARVAENLSDEEFTDLVEKIESKGDFIVWHYWEGNVFVFDIAGTKDWQSLADVTKELRNRLKSQSHHVSFFRNDAKNVDDLNKMRFMSASELKVTL